MKTAEMRERTNGELEELERELTRTVWKARFDNYTNQLDDTAKISRLRRDLARVKTIIAQRTQEQAKG